ncbi:MAG: TetR/AcrR family transcriptional regulator [Bryobacterales bacterium]|nr:TetR/AcrR family transcriptional regulator [Bryobacterales bacterium]
MEARAKTAEQTVDRILDAAFSLFRSRPFQEVTLRAIAGASGVTLQTVLRRFGSKEQLFMEAAQRQMEIIFNARRVSPPANIATVIATIVASYEEMGDLNWSGVSQEGHFPLIKDLFDKARAGHRHWIENCFADVIGPVKGGERERRVYLLFAATDFYMWKLFRRDLGMSRASTTARMTDLVNALARDFRRGNEEVLVRHGGGRG